MAQLAMSELEKAVAAKDLRVIEEACAVDHQVVYQKGAPPLARTLLHTACAAGVCDVAQYLIEHGALVNEKDGEQATPLILASESGSEPIVRLLLLTSARLEDRKAGGGSALHYACTGKHSGVLQILLEHRADVTAKTNTFWTPLHSAARMNNMECVMLLLQARASATVTTVKGSTPAQLAQSPAIKDVLMQAASGLLHGSGSPKAPAPAPPIPRLQQPPIEPVNFSASPALAVVDSAPMPAAVANISDAISTLQVKDLEPSALPSIISTLQERLSAALAQVAALNKRVRETEAKLKPWIINPEELSILKQIGEGFFGVVHYGTWRGAPVAVKQLPAGNNESALQELHIMQNLRPHCNVVQFLGYMKGPGSSLSLVCEYLSHGNLANHLRSFAKMGRFTPHKTVVKLAADTAAGMYHLHCEGILHRDLAARNLLIKYDSYGTISVAISDFGLSRKGSTYMSGTGFGPIKWMPPEFLMPPHEFTKKSDVWSFGVVIWEMLTSDDPYSELDEQQAGQAIVRNQTLPLLENWPEQLRTLMTQCWDAVPDNRPSFHECLRRLHAISVTQNW